MARNKVVYNDRISVSPAAFNAMCKAHAFCPSGLGHLDRMRWMGSYMENALAGANPPLPGTPELEPLGSAERPWDLNSAVVVAEASGFAERIWYMGPEELAHVLNTAMKTPGGK